MSSKKLCVCVRFAAAIAAVCGLLMLLWLYCIIGAVEIIDKPAVFAWRAAVTVAALPCFGVIVCMWAVSNAVSRDEVFTPRTAHLIERAATLLFADAPFVLVANVIMFLWERSHPSVLLISGVATLVLVALGLLAAVLSRYIAKAAELREDSEGTI